MDLSKPADATALSFFAGLSLRLATVDATIQTEAYRHVDYLADKANISRHALLAGAPFSAHPQMVNDAIVNLTAVLGESATSARALSDDLLRRTQSLQGWCTEKKAASVYSTIIEEKPQLCVEIGIYGGRSLLPAAIALKENGRGHIYGVETWDPLVATEFATNEANDQWWKDLDFKRIKREFVQFVAEHDMSWQIRIIEAPAARAEMIFSSIDYLHIDGGHSIYNAADDVIRYAAKVKSGGIIVMDDVNWPTTAPAVAILESMCDEQFSLSEDGASIPSCTFFRKR